MTENLRQIALIKDLTQLRVHACLPLPGDDGLVTVADDKSLRIWQKRQDNQFWPSVCHYLQSPGTALYLDNSGEHLLVGTQEGTAYRYQVQPDYNALILQRNFIAHTCPIIAVASDMLTVYHKKRSQCVELNKNLDLNKTLVITLGQSDRSVFWFNANNGEKQGVCSSLPDNATALAVDIKARALFVGLSSGMVYQIVIKQDDPRQSTLASKWNAHDKMAISSMSWCSTSETLVTTTAENWSSDGAELKVWFVGGGQGKKVVFCAHEVKQNVVFTEMFMSQTQYGLISVNQRGQVGKFLWSQNREIKDSPTWVEADSCQMCGYPFLWNIKSCWDRRCIGRRQHHCRSCGAAICANCWNTDKQKIPNLGFEVPVSMCKKCHPIQLNSIGNNVNHPQMFGQTVIEEDGDMAKNNSALKGYTCGESIMTNYQINAGSNVISSKVSLQKKWLIVSLNDMTVRIYDISPLLA